MPKIPLPFLLDDDAWRDLKPKPIDKLAQRTDLTEQQQLQLELFRTLDLRVEWNCGRTVILNNLIVFLGFTVLGLLFGTAFGQKALEFIYKFWPFTT